MDTNNGKPPQRRKRGMEFVIACVICLCVIINSMGFAAAETQNMQGSAGAEEAASLSSDPVTTDSGSAESSPSPEDTNSGEIKDPAADSGEQVSPPLTEDVPGESPADAASDEGTAPLADNPEQTAAEDAEKVPEEDTKKTPAEDLKKTPPENQVATYPAVRFLLSDGREYVLYENGNGMTPAVSGGAYFIEAPPDPTAMPDGMARFGGWIMQGETDPFDFSSRTIPANMSEVTFRASFHATYLIRFQDGDGNILADYTQEVMPGKTIAELPADVLDRIAETAPHGTGLAYWYTEKDGAAIPYEWGVTAVNQNMTLIPFFSARHTVVFVSAGSQVAESVQYVFDGHNAVMPDDTNTLVRPGWVFSHWSATEGGAEFIFDKTPIKESISIYAVWTPKETSYTVVVWMEKPGILGVDKMPAHPNGDKSQYEYITSITMAGISGQMSAVNESSPIIRTLFSDQSSVLKYAYFQDADQEVVLGNGQTIIDVYAARKVYTYQFDLNREGSEANKQYAGSMTVDPDPADGIGGKKYWPTLNAEKYSFKAKYQMRVLELFPTRGSANASFEAVIGGMFGSWIKEHKIGGPPPGTNKPEYDVVVSPLTLMSNFIPDSGGAHGDVYTLKARWVQYVSERYKYFEMVEALDEWLTPESKVLKHVVVNGVTRDVNHIELNGKTYVRVDDQTKFGSLLLSGNRNGFEKISKHNVNKPWFIYKHSEANGFGTQVEYPSNIQYTGLNAQGVGMFNYREGMGYVLCFGFSRNSYDLTFNMNLPNGTAAAAGHVPASVNLPYQHSLGEARPAVNPTLDGYTFKGWYKDDGCREAFDFENEIMRYNGVKIFAKWESTDNTVNFYEQEGGTLLGGEGVANGGYTTLRYYEVGKMYPNLGEFRGWFYQRADGRKAAFSLEMPVHESYEVYASWKNTGFTVTYDAGGGTGTVPADAKTYTLGECVIVKNANLKNAGQVFYAWQSDYDGNLYYPGSTVTITGNIRLSAQYRTGSGLLSAKIGKQVVSANPTDQQREFTFTAYLYNMVNGQAVAFSEGMMLGYTGGVMDGSGAVTPPPDGTLTFGADGGATFTLKHGQTITIQEIPSGSCIRVVENMDSEDPVFTTDITYSSQTVSGPDTGNTPIALDAEGTWECLYTNTRKAVVPTGLEDDMTFGSVAVMSAGVICAVWLAVSLLARNIRRKRPE